LSNNIIYGTTRPGLIELTNTATLFGSNNWLSTSASTNGLDNSIRTASPSFKNAPAQDYTLAAGSACIGAANTIVYGLPGREYYRDENLKRRWRIRAAARDLGAFESTSTGAGIGPYDAFPQPKLDLKKSGSSAILSWPLYAANFKVEESTGIIDSNWIPSSMSRATGAAEFSASLPISTNQKIFRLKF
jgi:hypothetical protein